MQYMMNIVKALGASMVWIETNVIGKKRWDYQISVSDLQLINTVLFTNGEEEIGRFVERGKCGFVVSRKVEW